MPGVNQSSVEAGHKKAPLQRLESVVGLRERGYKRVRQPLRVVCAPFYSDCESAHTLTQHSWARRCGDGCGGRLDL